MPLDEVESARSIARRFVASAMSVGALSPEAHQAVTIGMQRAGGAANTGEGGEDPAWYRPAPDGERHDARIKQVASARFGVTATYLARADQLEIKIAQGSKPGEGGQLPAKKATAEIAALRRAQPGQSLISPPPHHDIYSIEDLAQLIADLRAINPAARIGVKLVASRGVGTIAAGVVKAGADYIHLAGHAGGARARARSARSSMPGRRGSSGWPRSTRRCSGTGCATGSCCVTDGGLQVGRDVLVAALLGAEEFGFGTAALVALGCDMARQCHLDTCPTGIATQRADLRAKFSGTPEQVERFALAVAEDVRVELAAIGARTVGEIVGEARRFLVAAERRPDRPRGRSSGRSAGPRAPTAARRTRPAPPTGSVATSPRRSSTPSSTGCAPKAVRGCRPEPGGQLDDRDRRPVVRRRAVGCARARGDRRPEAGEPPPARPRGLGRAELRRVPGRRPRAPPRRPGQRLRRARACPAGRSSSGRSPSVLADPAASTLAGNVCLFGATAGRLHVVGRAGMRFAVRNSGAEAVVEGLGAHGCEYMTGGVVVVLGPIGANFGAGMTGGSGLPRSTRPAGRPRRWPGRASSRPACRRRSAIERTAPSGRPSSSALSRPTPTAGSELAERLVLRGGPRPEDVWLVEPIAVVRPTSAQDVALVGGRRRGARTPSPSPVAASGDARCRSGGGPVAVPTLS